MKRTLSGLIAAGALTSLLTLGLVPKKHRVLGLLSTVHAQEGCSLATLQGDYLVTGAAQPRIDQSDDPTFPRVNLAVWNFDGNGEMSGVFSTSQGGQITRRGSVTATYTLDSDCTGTMTFVPGMPGWDLFVTRDGSEGRTLNLNEGTIATRSFKKR